MTIILRAFLIVLVLTSTASAVEWTPQLAASISQQDCKTKFQNPNFIKVPLDSQTAETMDLFYFTLNPWNPKLPTLLNIDGGPGQAIGAGVDLLRFTETTSFNVVYFHPRGAGCSQLPLDNSYDKYVRTLNLIDDMEAIKKSLNISKWDIVFGLSYGSVAALKYAEIYPQSMDRIIIEGMFNPTYKRDQTLLAFTKGAGNFANIISQWPEYSFLDDTQRGVIFAQLANFLMKGEMFKNAEGIEFTTAELQKLAGALFNMTYTGVYSAGPMNRSAAMQEIQKILTLFLPANVATKVPGAVFSALNNLPYLSMRNFALLMVYDSLDLNFVEVLRTHPEISLESALHQQYPVEGNYISVENGAALKMLELPKQLSKSIALTFLLGTEDGPTPYEGATEYLKTLDANFQLYGLTGYAHQRHFSDTCYSQIFDQLLISQDLSGLFTTPGSMCLLPAGYVTL